MTATPGSPKKVTAFQICEPQDLPNAPGVYAVFTGHELLYIGSAVNLRTRLFEQGIGRRWNTRLRRFSRTPAKRVKIAVDLKTGRHLMREFRLIARLRPPLNVVNARPRRLRQLAPVVATVGAGCGRSVITQTVDDATHLVTPHARALFNDTAPLQHIAIVFIAAGGAAIVASYLPALSEFVPRKAATAAIFFGIGLELWAGFERWIGNGVYWAMLALLVLIGVMAAWPYVKAAELALARLRVKVNGRLSTPPIQRHR